RDGGRLDAVAELRLHPTTDLADVIELGATLPVLGRDEMSGGAIRIRVKGGPVRELGGRQPCGPDRALALTEHYALLRTGDTTALCDLATGQRRPLALPGQGLFHLADDWLVVHDSDRARMFEIPSGREVPLPDLRVTVAWLDHGRLFSFLTDGTLA